MLGRTHRNIGIFTYCIAACSFSLLGIHILGFNNSITLLGIIFAAIGGLFPDSDIENSTMRKNNFLYTTLVRLKPLIYFIYGVTVILATIMVFCNIFGISTSFMSVPEEISLRISNIVGGIFLIIMVVIVSIVVKKFVSKSLFLFVGFIIVYYNLAGSKDIIIFLIAAAIAAAPFFPHRTFTHSIEGLICYSFSAIYLGSQLGYTYLGVSFSLGYFSHIWITDFLTHNGILLSSTVYFLGQKNILSKNSLIYVILGRKKSLKLMTTGTQEGNFFEKVYTIIFAIITIIFVAWLISTNNGLSVFKFV